MKLNRLFSGLLAAAMLCSMLAVAPASAAKLSAFPDITDPATAEAAEILRVMGIVDGDGGGSFRPANPLDRAAFCKMAVEAMGNGSKAQTQQNRTVFKDVPSTHWANGYINVATQASTSGTGKDAVTTPGIIRGDAYGNFNPNRNIQFAEAITILMRVLGYADDTVGSGLMWYDGYLNTAKSIELTQGVTATPDAELNRGQAAILFRNLLFTKMENSDSVYLTRLGGSLKDDVIVLSTTATAADGTTGSVQTSVDTYRTDRVALPAEMNGVRGKVALDKDEKLVAILPRESDTFRHVVITGSQNLYLTAADGSRIDVKPETVTWKDGEATTYLKVWSALKPGTSLVLCYNGGGQNDYIYVADAATTSDAGVLVLKNKPASAANPFSAMGSNAALYKNGMAVTASDLRQYDVGVLDRGSNTVQISDRRLTGVYENAAPNTVAPSSIKVMGYDFPVLASAVNDLQSFKIGDRMTLLLTHDLRVAGVVTTSAATATAVGIASVKAGESEVKLFDASITLKGENSLSEAAAQKLDGKLVTVSSSRKGYLNLSPVSSSGATTAIDMVAGTMGSRKLADNVKFYDSVEGGAVLEVDRDDIALARIPTGKIAYTSLDYAGRVAYVVMNDVTGDCYQYGYLVAESTPHKDLDMDGKWDEVSYYYTHTLAIRQGTKDGNADGVTTKAVNTIGTYRNNIPAGMAVTSGGKLAGVVELKSMKGIPRSAFDVDAMTMTTTDSVFPVAEAVQCFNKTTNLWYAYGEDGLTSATAFADTLTVYYDKAPEEGGKIRLVVVE